MKYGFAERFLLLIFALTSALLQGRRRCVAVHSLAKPFLLRPRRSLAQGCEGADLSAKETRQCRLK